MPIIEIGSDGLITVWNDAATRLFGWTADEVLGKPLPFIPPDKEAEHREMRAQDLAGTAFIEREIRRMRKDGTSVDLLVSTNQVRDRSGRVTGIVSIYQDVTARRAAERMMRTQARVLADMTEGVNIATEDGIITWTNPAEDAMFGYEPGELTGRHVTVLNAYAPEENERIVADVIARLKSDGVWAGEWSNRKKDGTRFTTHSRISAVEIEGQKYWVCVQEDVTEHRRLLTTQRLIERQLMLLVEASGTLLSSHDPDEVLRSLLGLGQQFIAADAYSVWQRDLGTGNWHLVASVGLSPSYERTIRTEGRSIEPPEEPMAVEDVRNSQYLRHRRAFYESEGIRSMMTVPLRMGGGANGTLVFYYRSQHKFTDPEMAVARALANLAATALTTAQMHLRERTLRTQAEAAERRAAFLAEAGEVLSSSLIYETTLATVAKLTVPWFADWCGVDVVAATGDVERVAIAHVDPAKAKLAHEYTRRFPATEEDGQRVVLRTGKPILYEEITDEDLRERVRDPQQLRAIQQLGLKSLMIVPLQSRSRNLGVLTFATTPESGRKYTPADLKFAVEIARRAATAVDNARLLREVQDSRDRLELAQRAARIGTFDWEMKTGRVVWTEEEERLFGLEPGTFEGDITGWEKRVHPEDAKAVYQRFAECWRNREQTVQFVFRFVLPTGITRNMEGRGRFFYDDSGRPVRMVGINIDVTDRHQAERFRSQLAAIVESSQDAIVSEDLNGVVQTWNKAAERMFGYTAEEMAGRAIETLAPSDRAEEIPNIIARVRGGEAIENLETVRRRKDGSTVAISLTVSPIRDADGRVTGVSKVARDITDRKRAEQMLARKAEELARSNADLEQFAYAAAHDLQEPLRNVCMYSQLLSSRYTGKLDADADTFIEYTISGAKRMQALVQDLLAYTRSVDATHTGGRTADANAALEQTVLNLRTAIEQHQAVVTNDPLPTVPVLETHLLQLMQNLISNALKYRSAERVPRIHVSAQRDGAWWVFAVSDNGIGIKPEYQERVFGVFKRLHGSEIPGTGIGLAICSRVAAHYGGRIWVESRFGEGSTFYFQLPATESVRNG